MATGASATRDEDHPKNVLQHFKRRYHSDLDFRNLYIKKHFIVALANVNETLPTQAVEIWKVMTYDDRTVIEKDFCELTGRKSWPTHLEQKDTRSLAERLEELQTEVSHTFNANYTYSPQSSQVVFDAAMSLFEQLSILVSEIESMTPPKKSKKRK